MVRYIKSIDFTSIFFECILVLLRTLVIYDCHQKYVLKVFLAELANLDRRSLFTYDVNVYIYTKNQSESFIRKAFKC